MSELKGPAHARAVGSFLLNLLQAEAGTGILEWFFPTFYTPRTVAGFSLKEALVSAVISFTAGFLIFTFGGRGQRVGFGWRAFAGW